MTHFTADDVRKFILDHYAVGISAAGLDAKDLGEDFDLLRAGVIDSLGVIELISAVEREFKVTVDFEQMEPADLTTVGPFSRYVAEHGVRNDS